jgi:hypothetical protein
MKGEEAMASRAGGQRDELEGKFSERHLKRRWRSDRRKKDLSSLKPLESDQKKRRRFRKPFDDNPSEEAIRGDWCDVSPDEESEEKESLDLDADNDLDLDFDIGGDSRDFEGY